MTSRGLAAGTVISGKYKLTGHLGGGGMGDVYRAEHQLAGRQVAIKLLRPELANNADVTRRFFQEAQAANRIRHPNIVDVFDADFSQQGPYVVMEYLEGASVAYALGKLGKFDLATALAVILPTLAALDAAHEQGIIHRDLKPENIFIAQGSGNEVRVKLLDFGIAKVLSIAGSPETNTGIVFGTPDYLSPEQASGDPAIDGRSDLFSVGTVLFELLTGRKPWQAPNAVATAYRIVHSPAPTLDALGVHVDPLVQRVLDVALAKDKNERFSSAAAFADALAPVAPDGPTRRDALRSLYDAVVAHQPTLAAPVKPAPSLSFEPSLPIPLREPLAQSDGWAPAPAADPPAQPKPALVAPTLVSNEFVQPNKTPAGSSSHKQGPPRPLEPPREPPRPDRGSDPARISRPEIRERPALPASTPSDGVSVHPTASSARVLPVTSGRPLPPPSSQPLFSRPLPEAVRGRCHVRGTLPRCCALWIERAHGKPRRDEVLSILSASLRETYRSDAFNALVWYEIESLHAFLEAATHVALLDDPTTWRALARDNFDRDLAPIFRPAASRAAAALSLLRRLPASFARLFDFVSSRVDELASNRVRVRLSSFEAASAALRFITIGMLDGMLSAAPGLMIRTVSGESSFLPELEVEVHWREIAR